MNERRKGSKADWQPLTVMIGAKPFHDRTPLEFPAVRINTASYGAVMRFSYTPGLYTFPTKASVKPSTWLIAQDDPDVNSRFRPLQHIPHDRALEYLPLLEMAFGTCTTILNNMRDFVETARTLREQQSVPRPKDVSQVAVNPSQSLAVSIGERLFSSKR